MFAENSELLNLSSMIQGFADKDTEALFNTGKAPAGPLVNVQAAAYRKLVTLHNAVFLSDLQNPRGNNLHALTGNRIGQHAIRVNDQYRICFTWKDDGPREVEIVDYH